HVGEGEAGAVELALDVQHRLFGGGFHALGMTALAGDLTPLAGDVQRVAGEQSPAEEAAPGTSLLLGLFLAGRLGAERGNEAGGNQGGQGQCVFHGSPYSLSQVGRTHTSVQESPPV